MTTNPLDAIQERADAAEPGPWFLDSDGISIYYVFHNGDTPDRDRLAESSGDDAVFIAHAREDVPRLVAALRAVERLAKHTEELHAELPEPHGPLTRGYDMAIRDIRTAIREALGG